MGSGFGGPANNADPFSSLNFGGGQSAAGNQASSGFGAPQANQPAQMDFFN